MTGGVLHSVGLFLFGFLTTAGSGTVLPPENVRLDWVEGPELSWTPPKHSVQNCEYQVNSSVLDEYESMRSKVPKPPLNNLPLMNGGYLQISIQTVCNDSWSEPVFITNNDTNIFRDLECFIFSSTLTRCSWKPSAHTPPDLGFFYRLHQRNPSRLQECPLYTYTNNMITGCELQLEPLNTLFILLNGTVNNRTIRNTYELPKIKLKLQPLNWKVTKVAKNKFHINWTQPEFRNLDWTYKISYNSCDQTLVFKESQEHSVELNRDPECPYCMSMRAELEFDYGETEWTRYECFDSDFSPVVFVVILIPLMLAVLALLTLFFCRKNKEKIFPKIPQPPDHLSHILDNNNKISFFDLHTPEVEEECHVTLVLDTSLHKPQL